MVTYKGTYSQYRTARARDEERLRGIATRQAAEIQRLERLADSMRGQTAKRARTAKSLGGWKSLARDAHGALADQGKAKMRQRRQIARGADRPPFGHYRVDSGVGEGEEPLDDFEAYARMTSRQCVGLQNQDQADGGIRQSRPDSGGVAEQDPPLQLAQLLVGNAGLGEFPETGIDAVDGFVPRQKLGNRRRRGIDAGPCVGRHRCGFRSGEEPFDIVERQRAGPDNECHGSPLAMRSDPSGKCALLVSPIATPLE